MGQLYLVRTFTGKADQLSTDNVLFTEILKKNGLRRLPGRDISISSSEEELSSGILSALIEDLSNMSWNGNHWFESTEPIRGKERKMWLRIPVCPDFRGR